ncbi:hypothetical protein [Halobaculum magnesiiphilum]|uniref:Uncharacterized protein n=1 Tax=Halobaculum magnesiiphilum TaxID=1017351 RepID=A0A8T8WI32_9EURY|nr:hypothetical protein [Halobaculum magnesiiphilum]QZP39511.1 hypothetical protein K6T50_18210 [Halobaculum magnesiiphilum]
MIAEQRDTIDKQQQLLDELTDRVDDLEDRVTDTAELDERVSSLERTVDIKHDRHLSWLDELIVGDESGYLTDEQEAFLDDHGSLIECLHAQSTSEETTTPDESQRHETTRLRRIVESVADTVGIDTDDALGGADEDRLTRLLKYGPSDITDRVYAVHHRCRDLLSHLGKWGTSANDAYGRRITITAATVKEKLGLKRDEQLTSTEVRRVFEKVASLASDSPRKVVADTGGKGRNRLVVYLTDEEARSAG